LDREAYIATPFIPADQLSDIIESEQCLPLKTTIFLYYFTSSITGNIFTFNVGP
jgi:hypothetical protein